VIHDLTLPHRAENADIVMPAWMAGIQIRNDASGNIRVTWIPALHAGMTPWKFGILLINNFSFTLRSPRLCGAISEFCFT
jgi:hypothetical protein